MLLLALIVFLSSMTLFNSGGDVVPSPGTGDVLQAPAPARAQLAIKRVYPMAIVAGTGFKSGEVVRIGGVSTRQVRASARGTFTLRLRATDPCNGFSVTAFGNKGSRAAVNYSQVHCTVP